MDMSASNKSVSGIFYDFDKNTLQATVTYRGQKYTDYANEYYGKVTIPDIVVFGGKEYRVTAIADEAFRGCKTLESVVIPHTVNKIGMFAFKDTPFENDTTFWEDGIMYVNQCVIDARYDVVEGDVTIRPDTRLIADYAFAECEKMRSIVLPDNLSYVGKMAFALCTGLEEVALSPRVEKIEELTFWACIGLKKIDVPESLRLIEQGAFAGCLRLDSIVVSPFNANYITEDGVLFTRDMSTLVCYPAGLNVTTYYVPVMVKEIGEWAFEAAINLEEVVLPDKLQYIKYGAFAGCESLRTINIPSNVELIEKEAFARCFALQGIVLPNEVRIEKPIGEPSLEIVKK